ncbi:MULTISPECIES: response regulator [unclassified Aureimonas]|uniref:response regulator n=1 Tax=unclassified Aureimonas TaxID=2615206 RepID=UPI0007000B4E|nr:MULTISPECIES: response regulator transcription factor [unclassified Aureimonas]KQT64065.1 hypothetical protein ASG62_03355 [Aureimonas sp. Leaf427]KQT81257.1 hypothetical protein ASG54_00625 [Aureimonas sp. Leaf460]
MTVASVATRVALVDDHPSVVEGLKSVIGLHPDLLFVGTAKSVAGVSPLFREARPEIAVLDIQLPEVEGLCWIAKVMSEFPKVKIILHSHHAEPEILRNALQMQVAGYVLKSSDPHSVVYALRSVRSGGTYVDPVLLSQALSRGPDARQRGVGRAADQPKVSAREMETLRLTALGYGIKEIAEEFKVSAKSIETYKLRASEKLGLKTRSSIVRHAIASGWLSTID